VSPELLSEIFDSAETHSEEPVLSIRDVSVNFGGVSALSGVTFDLKEHEVVSVIGPNGAGKSTLLNTVSGLVRGNASGEISLAGRQILGKPPITIAKAGVGRSFQDPPLIDKETVLENVMLGEHLRLQYRMGDQIWRRRRVNRFEDEARRRATVVLEFMGLSDVKDRPVAGLSYGVRKLIDIARCTVAGPRLLLLDEPTSGLDTEEQSVVGRILQELHGTTSVTILVVEHHMHVVRSVSDRVVGLESGGVVTIGTPDEVLGSEAFRRLDSEPSAILDIEVGE
jgi:branched-chain amino acid transport system ATP-binding protein